MAKDKYSFYVRLTSLIFDDAVLNNDINLNEL